MKVFCVGYPRTGTTSIAEFLNNVGFKTLHLDMDLMKKVMEGYFDESNLEPYQAFADAPFPYIYRDLYYRYPNSYFILTTRPTSDWLSSIRSLYRFNKKDAWKDTPENAWHIEYLQCNYGCKFYQHKIWASFYEAHNLGVMRFFMNYRRFLALDLTLPDARKANLLCDFLGLDKRVTEFPRLNYKSLCGQPL